MTDAPDRPPHSDPNDPNDEGSLDTPSPVTADVFPTTKRPSRGPWNLIVPVAIVGLVIGIFVFGNTLRRRAASRVNHVAMDALPKGVTVVFAHPGVFHPAHRYVGTLRPWLEAHVGPQFVSAYVSTVLVRPGAPVHHGDVVATLDCRNTSAESRAISAEARALQDRQRALASQAQRYSGLLPGGFVAQNDVDIQQAESSSEAARLDATRARLAAMSLSVDDCVLRAPFDGDVSVRSVDPGAFARPGVSIVDVVDRSTIRLVVDVPEVDFAAVAPPASVHVRLLAVHAERDVPISRRSWAADADTRTVHVEIDMADPEGTLPVNTTAEVLVHVGSGISATVLPLTSADIRGERADVFVNEHGIARRHRVQVVGESEGELFVTGLPADAQVVTEGRAALLDGDRVEARVETAGVP